MDSDLLCHKSHIRWIGALVGRLALQIRHDPMKRVAICTAKGRGSNIEGGDVAPRGLIGTGAVYFAPDQRSKPHRPSRKATLPTTRGDAYMCVHSHLAPASPPCRLLTSAHGLGAAQCNGRRTLANGRTAQNRAPGFMDYEDAAWVHIYIVRCR